MSWINRLRRELLHWHRRIGLLIAMLVVVLVATGVALNHSEHFQFDQQGIRQNWLLKWYALDQPAEYQAYHLAEHWLLHFGAEHLYLGSSGHIDSPVQLNCSAPFYGAVLSQQAILLALCSDNLLMLTPAGELIERVSAAELPAGYTGIGLLGSEAVITAIADGQQQLYALDLNTLKTRALAAGDLQLVKESLVPEELLHSFWRMEAGHILHWERLLLDIHSGRFLGRWGVWLVDAVAVALALLALSGSWLWLSILWGRRR